ncbi:hypothetical protein EOE48_05295 [Methylobacterium oryzihabitans]|uniref:Uncharacterized protein n=1 Tax=Methylobacterium oryzihabitans TaxID=2499852 RepID=A0A3S2XQU2_9HYPH|nr:hypothetical protein EOE48_05295 [Methylobacterium oryzihabitans]
MTGSPWTSVAPPLSRPLLTQGPPSPAEGGGFFRKQPCCSCHQNRPSISLDNPASPADPAPHDPPARTHRGPHPIGPVPAGS